MIRWCYYPRNHKLPTEFEKITEIFQKREKEISSEIYNYNSNDVLKIVSSDFINLGFEIEASKAKADKIRVPVLFGEQGKEDLAFEADGFNVKYKMVLEIEAGRAVTNYQFLKDFFQACMMYNVEYLCVAVRKEYRTNKDYEKVCKFFDAMYSSNRINTQLRGIIVVGY